MIPEAAAICDTWCERPDAHVDECLRITPPESIPSTIPKGEHRMGRYAVFSESSPRTGYSLVTTTWFRSSAWRISHDINDSGVRATVRKLR